MLAKTQERINQANKELDTLIGTRTNVIRRTLKYVQSLPELESRAVLDVSDIPEIGADD